MDNNPPNPRAEGTKKRRHRKRKGGQAPDPPVFHLADVHVLPPPPPPPPLPPAEAAPVIPGQLLLDEGYLCDLCQNPLLPSNWDRSDPERIVALACTQPPSHVFHGSCLDDWRTDPELGSKCPTCTLDPAVVLRRNAMSAAIKTRIKKKRESCWRVIWAEWARQRFLVGMIMMSVIMCLVVFRVLEEWIRGWSHPGRLRTEL